MTSPVVRRTKLKGIMFSPCGSIVSPLDLVARDSISGRLGLGEDPEAIRAEHRGPSVGVFAQVISIVSHVHGVLDLARDLVPDHVNVQGRIELGELLDLVLVSHSFLLASLFYHALGFLHALEELELHPPLLATDQDLTERLVGLGMVVDGEQHPNLRPGDPHVALLPDPDQVAWPGTRQHGGTSC